MSYSIHIDHSSKQVLFKLGKVSQDMRRGIRQGLFYVSRELRKALSKAILSPPKTGRFYSYKGRRIQSSAPGEYPRNRSGELRRSIGFNINRDDEMYFGFRKDYGLWVEVKPPLGGGRAPLKKIINENDRKIIRNFTQAINRELRI